MSSLSPGVRIGAYEVLASIGAGGMGEVYRARDTRLDRDVALKILPDAFANDPERLARFEREARTLASLNHPHIAQVYGLEQSGVALAIVMELVEGEDLAQRLARAPLATDEALAVASQIAEALESAHEQGIVHRDLKPANVKLRPDGTVKVLDFGLAKAIEGAGGSSDARLATSPAVTSPAMTLGGAILGTAAYMSPEQAKGKPVDRRTDIWSFGLVLYEMLTGRAVFAAEDVSETLAAVLTRDVRALEWPPAVPDRIRALVRDCLVREPRQRLRDIGEARRTIDSVIAGVPDPTAAPAAATPPAASRFVWPVIAAVAVAVAAVAVYSSSRRGTETPQVVQFDVTPIAPTVALRSFQLSPDGRRLAYASRDVSESRLYVHTFATATAQPLKGTEAETADEIAWSPDSASIVFRTRDRLKRVRVDGGGDVQTICTLPGTTTPVLAWGIDDTILIGQFSGPLLRVPAAGGDPRPATALDTARREVRHVSPEFLPDGRHYVFLSMGPTIDDNAVYVGSLDSSERRQLAGIASGVRYASGHLLFLRGGALMAQPFDPSRMELHGEPFMVVDALTNVLVATGPFSVSANGTLAYRLAATRTERLAWFDRTGTQQQFVTPVGVYGDFELSPDERYIAYEAGIPGDIWVLDLTNGIPQQLTTGSAREADPVWSPDNRTVAFRSDEKGGQIHARAIGAVGPDRQLRPSDTRDSPEAWSRDGKYLAFESRGHVWALPLGARQDAIRLSDEASGGTWSQPAISPDGRWVALTHEDRGQPQVYLQSFPHAATRQRISASGGSGPRWSADGRELYFVTPDRQLMAVTIGSGADLRIGAAQRLFTLNIRGSGDGDYIPSKSGRFLAKVAESDGPPPMTVVLNWGSGLK